MDIIAEFIASAKANYIHFTVDVADPRTNDWFLMRHPIVIPIILTYIYIVKKAGPRFMEDREPFDLKIWLIAYNFMNVLISVYLFKEGFHYGWFNGYSLICQPTDFSDNPKALRAANACYWYFLAKIFELMDTVFFILRKKYNQVTFLHVYHHSVMPFISWCVAKYLPGGHWTFIGFINCFTHIIMYTYYMLAAMGPTYQKYLWWKKYITTVQLVQFCIVVLHSMQLFIYDCDFPKWSTILTIPNAVALYYLFTNFYKKSYASSKSKRSNNEVHCETKMQEVKDGTNGQVHNHDGISTNSSDGRNKNNCRKENKSD